MEFSAEVQPSEIRRGPVDRNIHALECLSVTTVTAHGETNEVAAAENRRATVAAFDSPAMRDIHAAHTPGPAQDAVTVAHLDMGVILRLADHNGRMMIGHISPEIGRASCRERVCQYV